MRKISLWLIAIAVLTFIGYQAAKYKSGIGLLKDSNSLLTDSPSDFLGEVNKRWVYKMPCSLPCYENIYVGDTPASEAILVLEENTLVNEINNINYNSGLSEINWIWKNSGGLGGRLFYRTDDKIISQIHPDLYCCLLLGDIVTSYGEPSHIWIVRITSIELEGSSLNYTLIWWDIGLSLNGSPSTLTEINGDFLINKVILFPPRQRGFIPSVGNVERDFHKWVGYGDISLYYIEE